MHLFFKIQHLKEYFHHLPPKQHIRNPLDFPPSPDDFFPPNPDRNLQVYTLEVINQKDWIKIKRTFWDSILSILRATILLVPRMIQPDLYFYLHTHTIRIWSFWCNRKKRSAVNNGWNFYQKWPDSGPNHGWEKPPVTEPCSCTRF